MILYVTRSLAVVKQNDLLGISVYGPPAQFELNGTEIDFSVREDEASRLYAIDISFHDRAMFAAYPEVMKGTMRIKNRSVGFRRNP